MLSIKKEFLTCSILNCYNNNKETGLEFYPFPKNEKISRKWLSICKDSTEPCVSYACASHFCDLDFVYSKTSGNKVLNVFSVPIKGQVEVSKTCKTNNKLVKQRQKRKLVGEEQSKSSKKSNKQVEPENNEPFADRECLHSSISMNNVIIQNDNDISAEQIDEISRPLFQDNAVNLINKVERRKEKEDLTLKQYRTMYVDCLLELTDAKNTIYELTKKNEQLVSMLLNQKKLIRNEVLKLLSSECLSDDVNNK